MKKKTEKEKNMCYSFIINRKFKNLDIQITLTNEELMEAYRKVEKEFLKSDIKAILTRTPLLEEAEKLPEIMTWLVLRYNDFYDVNIAHNEIIEVTLNHFWNASLKKEFFKELSKLAKCSMKRKAYKLAYQSLYLHNTENCSRPDCLVCQYLKREITISDFLHKLKEESLKYCV